MRININDNKILIGIKYERSFFILPLFVLEFAIVDT